MGRDATVVNDPAAGLGVVIRGHELLEEVLEKKEIDALVDQPERVEEVGDFEKADLEEERGWGQKEGERGGCEREENYCGCIWQLGVGEFCAVP